MDTSSSCSSTEIAVNKDEKHSEEEYTYYEVEKLINSTSAFICVVHKHNFKEQKLVFKILREYKDERYHYASAKERLQCQKEAWRKNFLITPAIYLGLAHMSPATLLELEEMNHRGKLQSIVLGPAIQESEAIKCVSEQDGEYALMMSYVLEEQRLDALLRYTVSEKQKELYLLSLALRIAQMHKTFPLPDTAKDEHGEMWGSYKQLDKKLAHNLKHFDMIERYDLTLYEQHATLKEDFSYFIQQEQLRDAFEERRKDYVKQCHGDLKTKNIWLETIKTDDPGHNVHILDAVDFNESYRNIDVLADLAMLVVDVEAIGNEELGALLKEKYLFLTEQTGDVARLVLAYYLLEKAIVCAIVCIVYDHCELYIGQRFLELAEKYSNELRNLLNSPTQKKLVSQAA